MTLEYKNPEAYNERTNEGQEWRHRLWYQINQDYIMLGLINIVNKPSLFLSAVLNT